MGVSNNYGQLSQPLVISLKNEDSETVELKIQKLLYKDTVASDKFEAAERKAFIRSVIHLMGEDGCLTEPIAA